MSHKSDGKCEQCQKIFDRYPGFYKPLRDWFEEFQAKHPEAHISCAGRGEQDQEAAVLKHASRAHFGKSAHNFNAAIDLFEMSGELANIYEASWFKRVLAPAIPHWLNWYGEPGAIFYELPHVEVRAWKTLVQDGKLKLIEDNRAA